MIHTTTCSIPTTNIYIYIYTHTTLYYVTVIHPYILLYVIYAILYSPGPAAHAVPGGAVRHGLAGAGPRPPAGGVRNS